MTSILSALWISCRPRQWIKNTFVFLPVLFAKLVFVPGAWLKAAAVFVVFCVVSSGMYLWNDVMDRTQDRVHPLKRSRPIASGNLAPATALAWAVPCVTISLGCAFWIQQGLGVIVAMYVVCNLLYTKWLRNVAIVDVFTIAAFFVLRVVGGLVVLKVSFSYWMLIMTWLLALFLALNKRRYELVTLARRAPQHRRVLRQYNPALIDQMCAAITASVLIVYILFTLDPQEVEKLGSHNLAFSIPFVCYGVFRYQYLVFMRGRGGDPANILLADRAMWVNILLWALVCGAAIYTHREWLPFPSQ